MVDHAGLAWEVLASMPYATGRLFSVSPSVAHQRLVEWLVAAPENTDTSEEWLTLLRAGPSEDVRPQPSGQEYARREFSLRRPIWQAIEGQPDGGGTVGFLHRRGSLRTRWSLRRRRG